MQGARYVFGTWIVAKQPYDWSWYDILFGYMRPYKLNAHTYSTSWLRHQFQQHNELAFIARWLVFVSILIHLSHFQWVDSELAVCVCVSLCAGKDCSPAQYIDTLSSRSRTHTRARCPKRWSQLHKCRSLSFSLSRAELFVWRVNHTNSFAFLATYSLLLRRTHTHTASSICKSDVRPNGDAAHLCEYPKCSVYRNRQA